MLDRYELTDRIHSVVAFAFAQRRYCDGSLPFELRQCAFNLSSLIVIRFSALILYAYVLLCHMLMDDVDVDAPALALETPEVELWYVVVFIRHGRMLLR